MAAWQRAFWRCSEYRFCMTVWIKEWLSLLLSRPHLCLLSLCGGQQEFPSINQKPMQGLTIVDLLTRPNAEGSVEIIQMEPGRKKKTKTKSRQASPACHRCPRIDFFLVSWRKWVRNYCLARGSTKLDSLCVCSQQSVSKVNLDWLWSKHIFIQIGSFYRREWNNCPPKQEMRSFMYVQDIHPGVRRCVFPDFSIKCTGDTAGVVIGMRTPQLCFHISSAPAALTTPCKDYKRDHWLFDTASRTSELQCSVTLKEKIYPELKQTKAETFTEAEDVIFFLNMLPWQRIILSGKSLPFSDSHFLPRWGATSRATLPLLD